MCHEGVRWSFWAREREIESESERETEGARGSKRERETKGEREGKCLDGDDVLEPGNHPVVPNPRRVCQGGTGGLL